MDCSSLKQIEIPNTVKTIGSYAFKGSGLSTITLPTGLETIGGYAFYECKDLTSAPIPNTVTSIGTCAFRYTGLTGEVTIPGSAKIAGTVVFADNLSLTGATIGTGDTELVLPLGFLYGCRSLKKVTFPSNTKELKNRTLWGCSNLAEIYCYAKEAPKIMFEEFGAINSLGSNEYTGINVPKENRKLYVPKGSKDSYTKEKQTYTNDKGEEVEEDNYWKTILIGKLGYEILEIEEESSTSPDTEGGE